MLHDAIVIGGRSAGATAGLVLARAGWRIAIIEKTEFPRRKVCGEFLSAIRAAATVAHWVMQPAAVALTLPLLRTFPLVLTESARTTGKVSTLCSSSF